MATTDRLQGTRTSKAIKGPALVATTAAITLSGEQTIDSVALVSGDRVLVKDQADGTENGIYVVDTGPWGRAQDFNKSNDIAEGTLIAIAQGATYAKSMYILTTPDAEIATTALTFARYADPAGVAVADAAAAAALASELAAAASEAAAAASEAAADADRIAAQAAAAAAAISETNAGNSETAAGASETAAGLSETAAALSETNAGASETAAAASAAAALVSEGNAATSEANAAASEAGVDADRIAAQAAAAAAALSESNAATSETNAGTSETNAGTSETNAGNSETAAIAAQAAAEAALDEFTDLYLGPFAANPTLDNDGNALQDGALYWNNVALEIRAYDLGTTTWYTSPSFNSADYVLKAGDTMTGLLTNTAGVNSTGTRNSAGIGIESFKPTILLKDNSASAEDFLIQGDGNTLGFFNIPAANDDITAGTLSARVDGAGTSAPATTTIITREKGDNRYAQTVGTPVDNQIGVWTGDGTLEGDPDLTWNGINLLLQPAVGLNTTLQQWVPDYGVTGPRALSLRAPDTDTAGAPFRFDTGNSLAFRVDGADRLSVLENGIVQVATDLEIVSANPTIVFEDSDVPSVLNELSLNGAFMTVDLDMNTNTSAGGFSVDFNGTRLFNVSDTGAILGVQFSAENRSLKIVGTDALQIPNGTTAQRPSTGEVGDIRYNSTLGQYEGHDGSDWAPLGGGGWTFLDHAQPTVDVANVEFAIPAGQQAIRLQGVVGMTNASSLLYVEVREGAGTWRRIGNTNNIGASGGSTLYFDLTISNLDDLGTSEMVVCTGFSYGNNVFFAATGTTAEPSNIIRAVLGFTGVAEVFDAVRLVASAGNIEGGNASSRGIILLKGLAA